MDKTGDLRFVDFVVKDWRPLLGGRERRRKHQGCFGEGFRNAVFGEKKKNALVKPQCKYVDFSFFEVREARGVGIDQVQEEGKGGSGMEVV